MKVNATTHHGRNHPMPTLDTEYLEWLEFDLRRIALPRHNELAYFYCVLILTLEAL
jgi:hypothetical protein